MTLWIPIACWGSWTAPGVELRVQAPPDRVHEARLEVHLEEQAEVEVRCTAADDDDERHRVGATAAADHELVLTGLLADTTYACALVAGQAELEFEHTSDPLPSGTPTWELSGDPDAIDGTWTLFNHGEDGYHADREKLVVVDPQGRIRWTYELPPDADGGIDASLVHGQVLYGGSGFGGRPTQVTLSHERTWEAPVHLDREHYHHHVQDVAGEGVLTLVMTDDSDVGGSDEGFAVELLDRDTGEVTWRWSSAEAIETGDLPARPELEDPYHANWADWLADEGQVVVSLRGLNRVIWVDRASRRVVEELGPRTAWELVDPDGAALPDSEWFYAQHAPEFSHGEVLVYDNGTGRPDGDASRVVAYSLDTDTRLATKLWQWTEPDFYESIWGEADRTPGGEHVLIARGHCGNCPSAIPGTHSALVEVDPATGDEVWRLQLAEQDDGLYRAERLDGCALFTHAGWCEER